MKTEYRTLKPEDQGSPFLLTDAATQTESIRAYVREISPSGRHCLLVVGGTTKSWAPVDRYLVIEKQSRIEPESAQELLALKHGKQLPPPPAGMEYCCGPQDCMVPVKMYVPQKIQDHPPADDLTRKLFQVICGLADTLLSSPWYSPDLTLRIRLKRSELPFAKTYANPDRWPACSGTYDELILLGRVLDALPTIVRKLTTSKLYLLQRHGDIKNRICATINACFELNNIPYWMWYQDGVGFSIRNV